MCAWLVAIRPFRTCSNLYLNITNEISLIIIFVALFLFNIAAKSDQLMIYSYEIGWALIALVLIAILQSWGFLLPIFCKAIKKKCCPKTNKQEEEDGKTALEVKESKTTITRNTSMNEYR